MGDDAKRFPATDLKLERLRSDGIIPQSREVLLFGAFVGVGAGVSILLSVWLPEFDAFTAEVVRGLSSDPARLPKLFEQAGVYLVTGVLLICGLIFLMALTVGLLQTRFLLVFKQLVPSFGRVLPSFSFGPIAGLKRAFRSLVLLATILAFFAWYLKQLFFGYNQEVVRILSVVRLDDEISRVTLEKVFEAPLQFLLSWAHFFYMSLLFMLFFLALGCYLIDYFSFRRAQRMTRGELEEEYREMETPGDFDSSRRELLEDS